MDEMNRAPAGGKILYWDNPAPRVDTSADTSVVEAEIDGKQALDELLCIMREEEMDPVVQLAGYFVTEDPTYLPAEHHARGLARRVGRDKLLKALIEQYVDTRTIPTGGDTDL